MKSRLLVAFTSALIVVGLCTWPAAGVLFTRLPSEAPYVSANSFAFALIAASYAVFFWALAFASSHLPKHWPILPKAVVIAVVSIASLLLAPYFALVPLFSARAVCWSTTMCGEQGFMQYLPHALFVSSTYPVVQLFLALPFVVLLLVAMWQAKPGESEPAHA